MLIIYKISLLFDICLSIHVMIDSKITKPLTQFNFNYISNDVTILTGQSRLFLK